MRAHWTELIVTDTDGHNVGTLAEVVRDDIDILDTAVIFDGVIESWPDYFISRSSEDPGWDTPAGCVVWNGFKTELDLARFRRDAQEGGNS